MSDILPKLFPERYAFLKGKRTLDLLLLDEEVSQISVLVQDAAECAAQANEWRESSKDFLNEIHAVVGSKLRSELLSSGKTRSETQIESEIPLDPEYRQAQQNFSESRLDAALWSSMVEGLRTKSSALRVSADLISAGFITNNYILEKRRSEIRKVVPRVPIKGQGDA